MASRGTLVRKSRIFGALAMECDISDCDTSLFGLDEKEALKVKTKALSDKGVPTLVLKGKTGYVLYTSPNADNYARHVDESNYEYKMPLCPFVTQVQWEEMIDNYFEFMMKDEEALAELRSIITPAVQLPPMQGNEPFDAVSELDKIRVHARSLIGSAKSQGTRRPNIFKLITNKNANWHFRGLLRRAVDDYVKLNTKKQWKK